MSSKVEEHGKCPICFEIPVAEIFQCVNGHHICSECCDQLVECPSCRLPYSNPKIRNRAMETLLDDMSFDCYNKDKGCDEKIHRSQMKAHLETCNYRPFHFCKLIGFMDCDFDANRIPRLTIAHLQKTHHVAYRYADEMELCHENFARTVIPGITKVWPPVLLKLDEDDYHTFLILGVVYNGAVCSWICMYMRDSQKDASTFHLQCSISNVFGMGQESKFTWNLTPISFKKAEYLLQSPPYTLPISFFQNHLESHIHENEGGLKLKLRISRNCSIKQDENTSNETVRIRCTS